ncbi:MAG: electron transfer flavoprotein subunit beta/FixA family protein [Saprospiraceae bacterium]|nr:electron transfer flavoprotein subunit beta/FixA family protein [Saprospiraceae bacterium]
MNSLVCISKTPDTTAKISFTEDGKKFNSEGVSYIMNPYDEWYALVKAIEVKEKLGGEVHVVNVGPASNDIIIRKALAIGADKAFRVDKDPESSEDVSAQVAAFASDKGYDIIFTGKETIDHNGSEVGAMLAQHMSLPFVSYASDMEADEGSANVTRDVEGGTQTVKVSYPFVVSAAKGLAEQRIPNMRGIMMAKRKPLEVVQPVDASSHLAIQKFELPAEKTGVTMIDENNMDELVRLLHEEAKVI